MGYGSNGYPVYAPAAPVYAYVAPAPVYGYAVTPTVRVIVRAPVPTPVSGTISNSYTCPCGVTLSIGQSCGNGPTYWKDGAYRTGCYRSN
jgi:hypothetical protein